MGIYWLANPEIKVEEPYIVVEDIVATLEAREG